MNSVILNKKKEKRWSRCKHTIFFNMYTVHEYQVEENVLTKIYLLANKIYCMYIPTAFSLWHREGPLTALKRFIVWLSMQLTMLTSSNNKWLAHASLSWSLYRYCVCANGTLVERHWPLCSNAFTRWKCLIWCYTFEMAPDNKYRCVICMFKWELCFLEIDLFLDALLL